MRIVGRLATTGLLLVPLFACVPKPISVAALVDPKPLLPSQPHVETVEPPPNTQNLLSAPPPEVTPSAPPWKSLPNGVRIQLLPDRLVGTVAVQLWVSGGVASEPASGLGLSHLTERLLLHELAKSASDNIRAAGGDVSSFTTLDHTVFQLLLPKGQQALALDFLAAVLMPTPTVDDAMVARQVAQVEDEHKRAQLMLRSVAVEKLRELSFPGHPYARPLLGDRLRLSALRCDDVLAYYRQTYQPAQLSLLVSGALADTLTHPLTSLLSGLAAPQTAATQPTTQTLTRPHSPQAWVASHDDPSGQAVVAFALPGVACAEEEVAAFDVFAQLVRSSLGFRSLGSRPKSEPAALSFSGRQSGLFFAHMMVPPSQVEEMSAKLLHELLRPSQRDLEPGELARAKQQLLAENARLLDTPSGRARRAGYFTSLGLSEDRYNQAVRELSDASLRQILLRHLQRDSLIGLWLWPRSRTPKDDAAQLERSRNRLLAQLKTPPPTVQKPLAAARKDGGVWRYQVPGGPLVLLLPDHSVPIVAAAATWPGGLSLEDEQTAGGHELISRLWKETPRARGGLWADTLAQLRGTVATQVERDAFSLVGEWPSQAEEEALPLFLDGLSAPEPSDAELELRRRQLVAELRQKDESRAVALAKLKAKLYGSHPYKLEPSVQSLSGLSRKRLGELFRRSYGPSQMTLAIVGDIEPYAVFSLIESRLQNSGKTASPPPSPLSTIETPRQYLSYHPHEQAILGLGFRTPGLKGQDALALAVLSEILVGKAGRLHRELVERRGLLLSLDGKLEGGLQGGALLISAVTTPMSLDSAEASLRDELRRLLDHPLSDDELQQAKRQLLAQKWKARQHRSDVALSLARRSALDLPSQESEEEHISSLTAVQVQTVAQRYLDEQHAVLQAVLPQALLAAKRGDARDAKAGPKLLAKLSPNVSKSGSGKAVRKQRSRR
jgi:zinc protease